MTNDEILAIAKESGLQTYITRDCHPTALIKFSNAIAARQREIDAGLCIAESKWEDDVACRVCAQAIREQK